MDIRVLKKLRRDNKIIKTTIPNGKVYYEIHHIKDNYFFSKFNTNRILVSTAERERFTTFDYAMSKLLLNIRVEIEKRKTKKETVWYK